MKTVEISQQIIHKLQGGVKDLVACTSTIRVVNREDAEVATEHRRRLKGMIGKIEDLFRVPKESAWKAHKDLCALEGKFIDPLKRDYKAVGDVVTLYQLAEKRRQEADAARVLANAEREAKEKEVAEKKRIEDERLATAAQMEEDGFVADAQAILEKPIEVSIAPIIPKPIQTVEPIKGTHLRTTWKAEVSDFFLLVQEVAAGRQPLSFLTPNQSSLDAQARALKGENRVPGIKFVEISTSVDRG